MIVVLGATGNIGSALMAQLTAAGATTRAVTRDASRALVPADVPVVEADLTRPESLPAAFSGADSLFLLMAGPVDVDAVLRRAVAAAVRRVIVVSSSLAGSAPDSMIGRGSLETESTVRNSGLEWTILRPDAFASNALWWAPAIRNDGTVRIPRADVGAPVIDPADIASVARVALLQKVHAERVYTLTGPRLVSPRTQVHSIGEAIGRTLAIEDITPEQHADQLAEQMPREVAESLAGLGDGDTPAKEPHVGDVFPTVEEVTGAAARSFEAWAHDHADAFR